MKHIVESFTDIDLQDGGPQEESDLGVSHRHCIFPFWLLVYRSTVAMGKKRSRNHGARTGAGAAQGALAHPQHAQSLADDVQESRDLEFAAEKRQNERAKRLKHSAEQELSNAKRVERSLRQKLKKAKTVETRSTLLRQLRQAESQRKSLTETFNDANRSEKDSEDEADIMDAKTTERILKQAHEQQDEIMHEEMRKDPMLSVTFKTMAILGDVGINSKKIDAAALGDSDDDSSGSDEEADLSSVPGTSEPDLDGDAAMTGNDNLEFLDGTKVTKEDELALTMFESSGISDGEGDNVRKVQGPTIYDCIMEKVREKEEALARAAAEAADPERAAREKKIMEVYTLVGKILSRYRSGKIPKAFKIVPKLKNWEDLVYMTRPDEWSPAATFMATRILASNLKPKEAVRFFRDILLPRCLEDIEENKKLNCHFYQALIKAACKPAAFNKGILLPLCEKHACTFRQATVFGSVLSKAKISELHSSAALMFIAGQSWSPTNSIFVSVLLSKGFSLPYRVIDTLVDHFVKMKEDPRPLPLLWHKCLLVFAQRYKSQVTMEQKEQLKLLMRMKFHTLVTPEIRRELFSARNRGDTMDPDPNTIARAIAGAA